MARTLPQLQSELVVRIGDDTIDTDISAAWLGTSLQECLTYYAWPFLKATASGTLSSVTTAQSISTVFSVTDLRQMSNLIVSDVEYGRVDFEDKDRTGLAGVYALSPDLASLYLPGADGGSATMKYIKYLAAPTGIQTLITLGIPTPYADFFDEAVIAGAATRFFQNALKPGMADYWQTRRDYYLDSVIDLIVKPSSGDVVSFKTLDATSTNDPEY